MAAITGANLWGVAESARLFMVPTLAFIVSIFAVIIIESRKTGSWDSLIGFTFQNPVWYFSARLIEIELPTKRFPLGQAREWLTFSLSKSKLERSQILISRGQ